VSSKKSKRAKRPPLPKFNDQIPISQIRTLKTTRSQEILENARQYPLLGCWLHAKWKDSGITPVIVARSLNPERLLFGAIMVDLYCLGIKDAYARVDVSRQAFLRDLPRLCSDEPLECSVELAHEIVYGAMEFAASYGFQPHPDFTRQRVDQILDPPESHPRNHKVEFGKDGKPFYIPGPYDDERKIRSVINTLMHTAGEGNFDYIAVLRQS
jgi:hypothetical protein